MLYKLLMTIVTTAILNSGSPQNNEGILPKELLEIAKKNGCNQVENFYDVPGGAKAINPPYVYGYLSGAKRDSAAFWCVRVKDNNTKYLLVFVFKPNNHEFSTCPQTIEWDNPPGGLSIYKEEGMTLDNFIYVSNKKKFAQKGIKMLHNAISSYYDGFNEIFYCYKGRWLVRQLD